VGKTTLAHGLAAVLGLHYQRVQFTSDLLPADILGVNIYQRETGNFRFHQGPVFSQLLLADEINRASPKVQSALLEAMEERQVSIDGESHPLPTPFFVIATQNPSEQLGTFPLPESQLDRFLMRISLGYPAAEAERALLLGQDRRALLDDITPCQGDGLLQLQQKAAALTVTQIWLIMCWPVAGHPAGPQLSGRPQSACRLGPAGGRPGLGLLEGRDHVLPEDVKAIFPAVAGHRLGLSGDATTSLTALLDHVAIP
jgi:MoxR-like ATPase